MSILNGYGKLGSSFFSWSEIVLLELSPHISSRVDISWCAQHLLWCLVSIWYCFHRTEPGIADTCLNVICGDFESCLQGMSCSMMSIALSSVLVQSQENPQLPLVAFWRWQEVMGQECKLTSTAIISMIAICRDEAIFSNEHATAIHCDDVTAEGQLVSQGRLHVNRIQDSAE